MKEIPQRVSTSLLLLFIVKIFNSVSWCDAQSNSLIGANSFKSVYSCEDHIMHLTCPHRSLSLKIVTAKYGRVLSKTNICPPSSPSHIIKDCGVSNVKSNVQKLCNGKTECSFEVDDRNLGAFCVNVYKHLNIVFMCVVRPTTKEPPTTTPAPTSEPTTPLPIPTDTVLTTNLSTSSNLTNTNYTSSSMSKAPIKAMETTQEAIKVTPQTRKPIIDVYDRDVFSRNHGTPSIMTSGHHGISKLVISLLLFIVFDAYIFRVT